MTAQQLWSFTVLSEDSHLVSSIHIGWLTGTCNSTTRESDSFFWLPRAPVIMYTPFFQIHRYIIQENKMSWNQEPKKPLWGRLRAALIYETWSMVFAGVLLSETDKQKWGTIIPNKKCLNISSLCFICLIATANVCETHEHSHSHGLPLTVFVWTDLNPRHPCIFAEGSV